MTESNCIPTGPKFVDITGQRFGKLTVVGFAKRIDKQLLWNCVCDCGQECVKHATQIKYRTGQDCGCEYRLAGELKAKHPIEYRHWRSMRSRCLNRKSDGFEKYGAAGITICQEWNRFSSFLDDMGLMPTPLHQIDRFPNQKGNYEPGNCRWATPKEQCNNRTNNRLLTIEGVTQTMQQWCDIVGVNNKIVSNRLRRGWTAHEAVYMPPLAKGKVRKLPLGH